MRETSYATTGAEPFKPVRSSSRKRLWIALGILGVFFVIEALGGYLTGSLALLADAGHLLTDVASIGLALLAIWFASRPATNLRSYGYYRGEVFAALVNGLALWAVAGYIAFEALRRFQSPPEVESLPMLLVATTGLAAQSVVALVLHRSVRESLNIKAAYLHVATDVLQSVAVVLTAVLMLAFGWYIIDPAVSVLIATLIFWSGGRVTWEAAQVLMAHSPRHMDVEAVCGRFEAVDEVTGVHDLHLWSITTGYEVLSVHVTTNVRGTAERESLLEDLQNIASQEFGIAHVTIQLEASPRGCSETHHLAHPHS